MIDLSMLKDIAGKHRNVYGYVCTHAHARWLKTSDLQLLSPGVGT